MAKIVSLSLPAHGHVNPTLSVMRELVERGHHVVYYNTAEFQDRVAHTHAVFRAYPEPVPTSADVSALLSDGNMAKATRLVFQMSEHLVPFMLDELRREQPDLVIYDSIALWGAISARLLGLPTVASITHFIFDGLEARHTLREMLHIARLALPMLPDILRSRQRLARRYGKEIFQKGHLLPVFGDRNVMFTAGRLQPSSSLIDDRFRFVGPSINGATRTHDDFPLEQLTGRPLVYLSLGTIHHTRIDFYRTAFEAFAGHPGQFILSVGPRTSAADLGAIPANFLVRPSVPQLEVLQRADLFVTHGGMNSVHEGLYYGVPLVIVPFQMEQLFNARIVESCGAGILLGGGPPFGRVSALQLRAAVDSVLHTASYRTSAQAIRQDLIGSGGYRRAADEIEACAHQLRSREPLLD